MSESNGREKFLGTYFDRDNILRISRAADVIAWVILTVYILTWLFSVSLFIAQYTSGLMFDKGFTFLNLLSIFKPYLLEPIPGILYFFGLQGISRGLLIMLDMEDNTRRAARK